MSVETINGISTTGEMYFEIITLEILQLQLNNARERQDSLAIRVFEDALSHQNDLLMTFPLELHLDYLEQLEWKKSNALNYLGQEAITLEQYQLIETRTRSQEERILSFPLGEHEFLLDVLAMKVEKTKLSYPNVLIENTDEYKRWKDQAARVQLLESNITY